MNHPPQGSTSDTLSSDNGSSVDNARRGYGVRIADEEWRPIPDWPYKVSSLGNIRRTESKRGARLNQNRRGGTSGKQGKKYPNIVLTRDTERGIEKKTFLVHAIVSLVFLGPCPAGMEVDHKDGDRFNCRADNLEYKTPSENIRGAVARGHRGENRWNARLTHEKVLRLWDMHNSGKPIKAIAEVLGVNFTTVYHVLKGHNWSHVRPEKINVA